MKREQQLPLEFKPWDVTQELITPERAARYLENNGVNRPLGIGTVAQYQGDMERKVWTPCPVAIVFYEDGQLGNGQHRLWAILQSGIPQHCLVIRGWPRSAAMNIDTGKARTLRDAAHIMGDTSITTELIAVCRFIAEGDRGKEGRSNAQRMDYIDAHREAAEWAIAHGPRGKHLRNAIVLTAIARAFMHEADRQRLAEFGAVLSTGFGAGEQDSAAVCLRNHLLGTVRLREYRSAVVNNNSAYREAFIRTQNAIRYFMRRQPLIQLKHVAKEAYPLPGGSCAC